MPKNRFQKDRDGPDRPADIGGIIEPINDDPSQGTNSGFVYLNNSKVASSICNRPGIFSLPKTKESGKVELAVSTLPKDEVHTNVLLNVSEDFISSGQVLDEYDKLIMNMVYSLHLDGRDYFTPCDIANKMDGTTAKRISPERVDKIADRLQKLRTVLITIDCTEEFSRRGIISKGATAKYTGYLMPIEDVEVTASNGRTVHAYRLITTMQLYEYASKTHQIIKMPVSAISDNKNIPDGDTVAILRLLLYMRISTIKTPGTRMNNRTIRYETLFGQAGFKSQDYANWRKKYSQLHQIIIRVLEQFQANGLISSFSIYKRGKKILGVCIDY